MYHAEIEVFDMMANKRLAILVKPDGDEYQVTTEDRGNAPELERRNVGQLSLQEALDLARTRLSQFLQRTADDQAGNPRTVEVMVKQPLESGQTAGVHLNLKIFGDQYMISIEDLQSIPNALGGFARPARRGMGLIGAEQALIEITNGFVTDWMHQGADTLV